MSALFINFRLCVVRSKHTYVAVQELVAANKFQDKDKDVWLINILLSIPPCCLFGEDLVCIFCLNTYNISISQSHRANNPIGTQYYSAHIVSTYQPRTAVVQIIKHVQKRGTVERRILTKIKYTKTCILIVFFCINICFYVYLLCKTTPIQSVVTL
jgi:hypothetical protein